MTLTDVLASARLLAGVPGFLRRPLDPAQARAVVGRRRRERGADFLALARTAVYGHAASPYRALLSHAGCAYGDLERLVEREGLDGALSALCRAGVYVTVDEFKGRRPIVRGGLTVETGPGSFTNPSVAPHGLARTSGSRGPAMAIPFTLEFLADVAVDMRLTLDAWGPGPWELAYWDVPGAALFYLLAYAKAGAPPARWFSPVDPAGPAVAARYRWSALSISWLSRVLKTRVPAPETVPVDEPTVILDWLSEVRARGRTPLLLTYPSPAVRLCRAAAEAGVDLGGVQMRLFGEPLTPARLDVIRRSGAEAYGIYTTVDAWRIGEPCLRPAAADDAHVVDDVNALVQPAPGDAPELAPESLLLTSLLGSAPMILLNTSLGDRATMTTRRCGCAIERIGWTTHLSEIRSFEKLTAAGMTFLDTDVIRVLDEILPAQLGGGPTDYQLAEDEAADGRPRIRLLVHPRIGPLDVGRVSQIFLDAIGRSSGAEAMMARVWGDARVVEVERRPPLPTATGKILHLHSSSGATRSAPRAHQEGATS